MRFHFGVLWDQYTPAVEARLVRDIIAMMNARPNLELICCSESGLADRALRSLQVHRVPILSLARLWITYKVGPNWMDVPEYATITVQRDLHTGENKPNISNQPAPVNTIPDLSREAPPRNFRMPNPNTPCLVDPMFFIWQNTH